jgi:hypothetical protein
LAIALEAIPGLHIDSTKYRVSMGGSKL